MPKPETGTALERATKETSRPNCGAMEESVTQNNIIVIGAGVIGLSTARLLQDAYSTSQITIVAAEFPGDPDPSADFASVWAGAHYRPIAGSTDQLRMEAILAQRTAEVMKRIARETPEAGVEVLPGIEYLEDPPPENLGLKTGDIYAGIGDDFVVLKQGELPETVRWGCKYMTYSINVPMYCSWLLEKFQSGGGKCIRQRLSCAQQAFEVFQEHALKKVSLVVNCSGRNFDLDSKMDIIRGQTVLVEQEYTATVTRQAKDGSWSFLIPRPRGGGTIVGGTKEVGDQETNARPETTQKLLQQAVQDFPDFVQSVRDFKVVKVNVGRRPWREGGTRLAIEPLDGDRQIIHGYGLGGRGYELSWAVAERLLQMVESAHVQGDQSLLPASL